MKTAMRTDKEILEISGADIEKCMQCGRCSASCPSYQEMDLRPHQFATYLMDKNVEAMVNSKSLWRCVSCFCCVERCPRDVKPARLIEAARLMVIREQGEEYFSADSVPDMLDDDMPQQLLVSVFRKYRK